MNTGKDHLEKAIQRFTLFLQEKQQRKTPERFEVLRAVSRTRGLFTVDELYQDMQSQDYMMVSRTTLFNTIELLEEAGLVIKHALKRAASYEYNTGTTRPHVVMVCRECGKLSKLEDPQLDLYLQGLTVRRFNVLQQVLYLHGLCTRCNTKLKQKAKQKI